MEKQTPKLRLILVGLVLLAIALVGRCGQAPKVTTPQLRPTVQPSPHTIHLPIIYNNLTQPQPLEPFESHRFGVAGKGFGRGFPYYRWSVGVPNESVEFWREVWCMVSDKVRMQIIAAAQWDFEHGATRNWLIFNEPDESGQCGDYFLNDPEGAAVLYSEIYDLIKAHDPNAQLYVGGLLWIRSPETRRWWIDFIATLDSRGERWKVEGVHIHLYPQQSNSWTRGKRDRNCQPVGFCAGDLIDAAEAWYRDMHEPYFGDAPIIITEIGYSGHKKYDPEVEHLVLDDLMIPISKWFKSQDEYSAMFWFCSVLFREPWDFGSTVLLRDGELTRLGKYWGK